MEKKATAPDERCSSAACRRDPTHLAAGDTGDGLPELFCTEHLRVLTDDSVGLRPAGIRAVLWRVWDEGRAHHHTASCFLLSGLGLQTGLGGWGSWAVLGLLACSVVADAVAMRRWTYRLWPLSVAPLVLAVATVAMLGASTVSTLAVVVAILHACLLALAWQRSFAARFDPGPPRPGSDRT